MNRRNITRLIIIVIWLVSMGWLIRFEAYPEFFTKQIAGYKSLLAGEDAIVKDSWMKITIDGVPSGYSHISIENSEDDPLRYIAVESTTRVKMNMQGIQGTFEINTEVCLDILHRLQSFSFDIFSKDIKIRLKSFRTEDNTFRVVVNAAGIMLKEKIEIPDDVVIDTPMSAGIMKQLNPGESTTLTTIDPYSAVQAVMSRVDIFSAIESIAANKPITQSSFQGESKPFVLKPKAIPITALRKEVITNMGRQIEATVIRSASGNGDILTWVDSEGDTIRQSTAIGWIFERCSTEEAIKSLPAR